jgi:hypothetical protein
MAPDSSGGVDGWIRRPHAWRWAQAALPAVDEEPADDPPEDDPLEPDEPLPLPAEALADAAVLSDFLAEPAPPPSDCLSDCFPDFVSEDLSDEESDVALPTGCLSLLSLPLAFAAASRLSLR